ncbi:hypothetical protein K0B96_07645 [Horticoccus luteus]|uniref:Dolichyl-phosphate-mannose-protein mannosyltransferase n=1 Tax=Horticoccus luteus TaxID=2862869 RepID=A0A8F9XMV3_9BACT|nr:hypothetical protein [Horticoccus luteus]QYM80469.1 hypothetical protein K0B96_07645 [Horticoccus luteus]
MTLPSSVVAAKGYLALGIAGFFALVLFVGSQRRPAFFDEPAHLRQATEFAPAPTLHDWLTNNDSSAAGPLSPLLFVTMGVRTIERPPLFRIPNLILLAAITATLAAYLRRQPVPRPLAGALAMLALPPIWVCSGLALTEIPAMMGVAAALYAADRVGAIEDEKNAETALPVGWLAMLAAGIVVASCGRQTYLAILPALAVIAVRRRADLIPVGAAFGVGIIPIAAVMVAWGGLAPPLLRSWSEGLAPTHAVVALCYSGGIAFWLAPRLFQSHWRGATVSALVAIGLNMAGLGVHLTLFTSAQRFLGHPQLSAIAEAILAAVLIGAGAAWVFAVLSEILRRPSRMFIAGALGVLLLCASCMAIKHQFSSRYIGMAAPFFISMLAPWMGFGRWGCMRLAVGMLARFAVLASYFRFA